MSTRAKAPRVPGGQARTRILAAAGELLLERPFADLTVDALMARAGLARTVFYRHYDDLPQMAPDLLPDAEDPLVAQVLRVEGRRPEEVVTEMVDGLVALYAEHGPLLRAIDDAARHDRAVAERLDTALVGPRKLLARMIAGAPDPPPDVDAFVALLMATHRAYLLDVFGAGKPTPSARATAAEALATLWARLLN